MVNSIEVRPGQKWISTDKRLERRREFVIVAVERGRALFRNSRGERRLIKVSRLQSKRYQLVPDAQPVAPVAQEQKAS